MRPGLAKSLRKGLPGGSHPVTAHGDPTCLETAPIHETSMERDGGRRLGQLWQAPLSPQSCHSRCLPGLHPCGACKLASCSTGDLKNSPAPHMPWHTLHMALWQRRWQADICMLFGCSSSAGTRAARTMQHTPSQRPEQWTMGLVAYLPHMLLQPHDCHSSSLRQVHPGPLKERSLPLYGHRMQALPWL